LYWDSGVFRVALHIVFLNSMLTLQTRSVYRTIELSQGFEGQLSTVEAFFYGLDTFPLFLAIVVYIPFWPGRFIQSATKPVEEQVTNPVSPTETDEKVREVI
jgi:hypothetical protein